MVGEVGKEWLERWVRGNGEVGKDLLARSVRLNIGGGEGVIGEVAKR